MAYVHFYMGAVTDGGTDGQLISEGDNSNYLKFGALDVINGQESAPVKVAFRCEAKYRGVQSPAAGKETCYIGPSATSGSNNTKFNLAWDDGNGNPGTFAGWGMYLNFPITQLSTTNKVFWIKAKSVAGEPNTADITVKLNAIGQVEDIV